MEAIAIEPRAIVANTRRHANDNTTGNRNRA